VFFEAIGEGTFRPHPLRIVVAGFHAPSSGPTRRSFMYRCVPQDRFLLVFPTARIPPAGFLIECQITMGLRRFMIKYFDQIFISIFYPYCTASYIILIVRLVLVEFSVFIYDKNLTSL
jgi:hypothetical protein